MKDIEIIKFANNYRNQVLEVWERSVLASHDFLKTEDFEEIKSFVQEINLNELELYLMKIEDTIAGFVGVFEKKIEMLFIAPEYIGRGLGRKLLNFAIFTLNANKVDVNEQNLNAVKFYIKMGFVAYERTEKDDQGKDYPLLRMQLITTK